MTRNVVGRFALADRGTTYGTFIRTWFHNVPVDLLPPPSKPAYITDHVHVYQ